MIKLKDLIKDLLESDMSYSPSKKKPLNKKLKDGEGTEILHDDEIEEDINIPVKIGDTVLMGKFKNKKVKIKSIGKDDHGMPTINGKKAATFRIHNIVNIFDEDELKEIAIKLKNGQPENNEDWEKWLVARAKEMIKKRGFEKSSPYHKVKEDVKVVKKDGKNGGSYMSYTSLKNSDIEQPYKPKKQLKKN